MKMMHYVHQSPWAPSLQPFFSTFSRTSKHAKTFAHQQMRHSCEQCYCFSEVSARFQLRTCTVIVPKEVDDVITKLSIHTFAPMWCAILFLCLLLKKPNPPKTEDKTQGIIPFWRSFFCNLSRFHVITEHCGFCGLSTKDCTHIADHSCTSHVHAQTIWNTMKQYEELISENKCCNCYICIHLYPFVYTCIILYISGCPFWCLLPVATEFLEDAPQSLKVLPPGDTICAHIKPWSICTHYVLRSSHIDLWLIISHFGQGWREKPHSGESAWQMLRWNIQRIL